MFDLVRHVQRLKKSLVIGKRYRDTFLVHIESGKHIVVTRDERLGSHRSASLVQWLNFRPLYFVLSARGEPRHPSYRSQDEREEGNDHTQKIVSHPASSNTGSLIPGSWVS